MKILYLSQSYVPSRRADSIQVMRMCAALARAGHEVELVSKRCPSRFEPGVEDDHAFYGLRSSFPVRKLPRPAWRGGGVLYVDAIRRLLRRRRGAVDLVYARDLWGSVLACRLGMPVLFEAHEPPAGRISRSLHRRLFTAPSFRRLVVISRGLLEGLRQTRLLPAEDRIVIAADAADPLPEVADAPASAEAGAEGDRAPSLGYVGQLYPGRGIGLLAELAGRMPDCRFHVVGGHDHAVEAWRRSAARDNLMFHGFVRPPELPALYRGFDLLLMPFARQVGVQSGRSDTVAWMSPMKMFEYMATGRPILASDLPVLREVLEDGRNAVLLPPDDPPAWERAIRRLLADAPLRRRLGAAAREDLLRRFTWDARARRVLSGL